MMAEYTSGPWEWKYGGLYATTEDRFVLGIVGAGYGDEHIEGNDADYALIAAAPETKAQRDALLEAALKDEEADRHTLDCPDSYGGCPCDHYWEIKREAQIMRQAAIAQAGGDRND